MASRSSSGWRSQLPMIAPMRSIDMVMLQLLVHWRALPRKAGSWHWVSIRAMPTNTARIQG